MAMVWRVQVAPSPVSFSYQPTARSVYWPRTRSTSPSPSRSPATVSVGPPDARRDRRLGRERDVRGRRGSRERQEDPGAEEGSEPDASRHARQSSGKAERYSK